ncbi:MAG: Uma2 family endonuclease [Anaerolineae bacterium]
MTDMAKTRMTTAEFLELPESNQLRELIDGEIIVNPPKDTHQKIVIHTALFLGSVIKEGELRVAPTGVVFDELNTPEPDVFWVSSENTQCELGDDGLWHGAPDLIVEVLSPSTTRNDRVTKFQLYEKYGVREYWIADPEIRTLEVWYLENKTLTYQGVYGIGKTFTSRVLKTTVEVKQLISE